MIPFFMLTNKNKSLGQGAEGVPDGRTKSSLDQDKTDCDDLAHKKPKMRRKVLKKRRSK